MLNPKSNMLALCLGKPDLGHHAKGGAISAMVSLHVAIKRVNSQKQNVLLCLHYAESPRPMQHYGMCFPYQPDGHKLT